LGAFGASAGAFPHIEPFGGFKPSCPAVADGKATADPSGGGYFRPPPLPLLFHFFSPPSLLPHLGCPARHLAEL